MNVMIDTVHNAIRQIKRGGGWGRRRGGRAEQGVGKSRGEEQSKRGKSRAEE